MTGRSCGSLPRHERGDASATRRHVGPELPQKYSAWPAFDARVNQWLATLFSPACVTDTIDQIMAGQQAQTDHAAVQAATARIKDATGKMARYRAALDAGGDPEEIGQWIAEAKVQRLAAEAQVRQATNGTATLTRHQVQAVVEECADVARDLRDADPADIAPAYRKLGLRLTYYPGRNLVRATACPKATNIGKWSVSEGGLEPFAYITAARADPWLSV
jgi:hypothetical protein